MPKPQSENIKVKKVSKKEQEVDAPNGDELKNETESGFAEFTKKPLPSEKEVKQLDEYIESEVKEGDVNDSLSEIYQDDKGQMVDVDKLDIRKRGFFSWLLTTSLLLFIASGFVFLVYNYLYLPSLTDSTAVQLTITGDEEVFVGEEFSYTISYKNQSNVALENVDVEIKYPENFVVLDATPGSENFRRWHFDELNVNFNGKITVKGKIIAPIAYSGIMLANITYTPANFSSEFKKESSFVSTVFDTGINFNIDYISSVMMNDENDIVVRFKEQDESYIKNFRITVEPLENVDFVNYEPGEESLYNLVRPGVFDVKEIKDGEGEVLLKVKFNDKLNDQEELVFNFSQADSEDNYRNFHTETIQLDVIKSDLSLTLIINAKKNDQGASFSDKLNYSIVYSNKGETEMNDVIVMAVLDSEFLDWDSLSDLNDGDISGNTITWSKEEIPGLENLGTRDEGFIDFSINLVDKPTSIFPEKKYSIESYAQYRTASSTADAFLSESNKSNIIVNKISSDLALSERVMYFNDDNISVGSGPIPPKVGQVTEYKVYWELSNNLHELDNVSVSLDLPSYVTYSQKEKTSAGNIVFASESNSLIWEIGKMPITSQNATAEFTISVKPDEDYLNKIMILSPGAIVRAHDSEADINLNSKGVAKTTRLEDDTIAVSDGIITN
ncbi:MAG: hypothetical protein PF572_06230 [Patescibacteria group bacterium]|jgi:hypothetical protein|nr:hypothetical protein [Patescibacteria group bacterium]